MKLKTLQVIYNGEPLCKIYPHASKWQVFKYNSSMIIRKVLIIAFILGGIYGTFQLGRVTTAPKFVQAEDKSNEMFTGKIEKLKNDVVNKIRSCESAGSNEDAGLIVFDSNNKASIGTMQFQVNTIIHYYKTLYGRTITPKEAVIIALDDNKAGELAKMIMFTTNNKAGKDWVNCTNRYDIDKQIDLIKNLEK